MVKKKIKVMDTSFRDGFQSVFGARVLLEDFLPALQSAVDAGLKHIETAGGARFQAPIFFCGENAFETMDKIREAVGPEINLQSLSRGVNVVGLNSQSRDIIDLHAKLFKKHGVTTVRNFDALNDVDNLIDSANSIKKYGLKHEVTVTMMELPFGCEGAHDADYYESVLRKILDAGIPFDSVAFKDASGTSNPRKVFETIKRARKMLGAKAHIRFHSHETAGTAMVAYLAALDGGADGIDLAMKPVSGGTGQPDIISMWHALKGTDYDLGVDIKKIMETEEIFKECLKEYNISKTALAVNPILIQAPLPGGATTTTINQLKEIGMSDKFPQLVQNLKEVVERGGYGTSVTPVSQFYAQQAFLNTIYQPWEKANNGYAKMVLGYFGKTPCAPDPELVKWASEKLNLEPTTEKVVDINDRDPEKGIVAAKKRLKEAGLPTTDENIFIAAACKDATEDKGINFLLGKGCINVDKGNKDTKPAVTENDTCCVNINGQNYTVKFDGENQASVNGKSYNFTFTDETSAPTASNTSGGQEVKAAMPGVVLKLNINVGDAVTEGDVLLVVEAMKMEIDVKSPYTGKIKAVNIAQGQKVQNGQVMVVIE